MRGYFRGQVLVAISNGVMFSIGFWIIGLPMPVGMGIFVGVLSFIPYIQVLGILPAALLALLQMADTGHSFWGMMALVIVVYIVVQVLQDTIFTPRIMGRIMGLSPAVVLLSLSCLGIYRWHHRLDGRSSAHHAHTRLLSALHFGRSCGRRMLCRRNTRVRARGINPLCFFLPPPKYIWEELARMDKNRAKSEDFLHTPLILPD